MAKTKPSIDDIAQMIEGPTRPEPTAEFPALDLIWDQRRIVEQLSAISDRRAALERRHDELAVLITSARADEATYLVACAWEQEGAEDGLARTRSNMDQYTAEADDIAGMLAALAADEAKLDARNKDLSDVAERRALEKAAEEEQEAIKKCNAAFRAAERAFARVIVASNKKERLGGGRNHLIALFKSELGQTALNWQGPGAQYLTLPRIGTRRQEAQAIQELHDLLAEITKMIEDAS
jgi:hypothetical protein